MINYARCLMLSEKYGVGLEVIENDYLVEMILDAIARDIKLNAELVFRGGTCLHKVYFENYRFSEDIDFIFDGKTGVDAVNIEIIQILEKLRTENPQILGWTVKKERDRLQIYIQYDIIAEVKKTDKNLKLDFFEKQEMPVYSVRTLRFLHDEFRKEPVFLNVYTLETVAADKISRIISIEKEARDIYDLKQVFSENLDTAVMNAEFRKNHSFDIDPVDLVRKIAGNSFRRTWETRLSHQIRDLPGYDLYIRELTALIKEKYNEFFRD